MDINELLQAVKFQTGSSQEEIRLAEQALAKVSVFPALQKKSLGKNDARLHSKSLVDRLQPRSILKCFP